LAGFEVTAEAVAKDNHQKIVEVMRDATRKPSNALQLLCLSYLSFQLKPLGYIALYCHEASYSRPTVPDWRKRRFLFVESAILFLVGQTSSPNAPIL
jgi:hypothetical protein